MQKYYLNKRCVSYSKVKVSNIGFCHIVAVACSRPNIYRDVKWLDLVSPSLKRSFVSFIPVGRSYVRMQKEREISGDVRLMEKWQKYFLSLVPDILQMHIFHHLYETCVVTA